MESEIRARLVRLVKIEIVEEGTGTETALAWPTPLFQSGSKRAILSAIFQCLNGADRVGLVDLRDNHPLGDWVSMVVLVVLSGREGNFLFGDLLVGELFEKVINAIEAGFLLVVGWNYPPRGLGNIGFFQHDFLRLGVVLPTASRL